MGTNTNDVYILLYCSPSNHFRRLINAQVYDLDARIAKQPGNHFSACRMPVKAYHRHDNLDLWCRTHDLTSKPLIERIRAAKHIEWIVIQSTPHSDGPKDLASRRIDSYRFNDRWHEIEPVALLCIGRELVQAAS